jgi:hypothetical protein
MKKRADRAYRTPPVIESIESRLLLSTSASTAQIDWPFTRVVTAVTPAPPKLYVGNADFLPFGNRLMFNRIQHPNPTLGDTVHNIATLLIRNDGGSPLTIKSFTITGPFTLLNAPKTPLTLAVHQSFKLQVKFIATTDSSHTDNQANDTVTTNGLSEAAAGGTWYGTLKINSNDPTTTAYPVALAGYWQYQTEHENEPGLATIINLLGGWKTNIITPRGPKLTEPNTTPKYYGEELKTTGLWQAANTAKTVNVRMVAAFHNQGNASTASWYVKGSTTHNKLFTVNPDEGQTLLPHIKGSTTQYAAASFSTKATFGFDWDGEFTQDALNHFGQGGGHHVRVYPVRDQTGKIEPNNYFFCVDYSNTNFENFDFQDQVYYVENIKPSS